mgnify:FL=1|tara:strand:+ start:2846 stop:3298 length:453 start_codon:yes stop_codon:yes gene_type:complete
MGHLRKASFKDLKYVAANMREMDKLEAFYQSGQEPQQALQLSYICSNVNMAIADDNDQPIGLCGVVQGGVIWMVATDELFSNKKYKIQLIRKGREWVDNLLKSYKILYNFVYAENDSAIKWLKALGFTFIKYHEEYGMQGKPFYEFLRIA